MEDRSDSRIVVRLVTSAGALETSTTVVFPNAATTRPAAPAPTAAVPTVLAAAAAPEPATVLPTPPVVISVDVPGFSWLLLLGAFGIFGAIYSMTFMALPRAITGRVSRRQLGLPTRELPSMSEPGKRATAAIDEYLVSSGRGPRLATALDAAGIPARAGEFVVTVGTIAVAAALLGSVLGGTLHVARTRRPHPVDRDGAIRDQHSGQFGGTGELLREQQRRYQLPAFRRCERRLRRRERAVPA